MLPLLWSALFGTLYAGCLIDDQRCDAHQVELKGDYALCVCEDNAVFDSDGVGCTPCGDNALAENGVCVCKPGFVRASAEAPCEMSQAGARCSATEACQAPFPYCVMPSGSEGYCSLSGCTNNAGCPSGWTCEPDGSTRSCRKPPTGLGKACGATADCTGLDANFCETRFLKSCLIAGCASGTPACPNEWACCDYATFGVALSFCASPAQLTNGACPMGGTRVNP